MLLKITFLFVVLLTQILGRDICSLDTSVDITDGVKFENNTIEFNGTLYDLNETIIYDNTTRGCVCLKGNCYRKCCDRNQIYVEDILDCSDIASVNITDEESKLLNYYFNKFEDIEMKYGLKQVNGYNDLNNCDNKSLLFRTDTFKGHLLSKDGRLVVQHVEVEDIEYDIENYCIDVMIAEDEKTGTTHLTEQAYFCGKYEDETEVYTQSYTAMLISAVFILLTLAVHLMLPDMMKNLHGRILVAHLCSMFVAFVFIAAIQLNITFGSPTSNVCLSLTYVIYFSLLAAFFWLNVMCFDIWRTLSGLRGRIMPGDVPKRFSKYCVYAFGLPLLLTILLIILEFSDIEDHQYLPRIRKRGCFLSGKGKFIYLYIPIMIICILNTMLFVATAVSIACNIRKNTNQLRGVDSSKHSAQKSRDKQRFLTYLKLFVVMGLSWILEVISHLFPELDYIFVFTDTFNALSGLFIFIIVVCKKDKLKAIKGRFIELIRRKPKKSNSTATCSTDISLTSQPKEISNSAIVNVNSSEAIKED